MTPRILSFEGVENVRDYGGYSAAGRAIKPGRLYRSGHWANASDADLEAFEKLKVETIVDLRRSVEREHQPSRRSAACTAVRIETDPRPDDLTEAPHIAFLKSGQLTVDGGRNFMMTAYRRIPYEAPHLDLFRRYFEAVAQADGAVLIHCAAGKDRTGILAALTHRILDVHADDLTEDYLLTNTAVRLEERAPAIAERLARWTGVVPSHDAVVAFLGVEAAYLDEAFAEIDRQSGSLDAYLTDAVGLDAATRDRVIERLSD